MRRHLEDTEMPGHAHCVPILLESESRDGRMREWLSFDCGSRHTHVSFLEYNEGSRLGHDCHRLVNLPDGRSVFVSGTSAFMLSPCEARKARAMLYGKTPESVAPVEGYCRDTRGREFAITRLEGTALTSSALFEALAARGRSRAFRLDEISSMPEEYRTQYAHNVVRELAKLHSSGMLLGTFKTSDTLLARDSLRFADAAHLSKLNTSEAAVRELFFVVSTLVNEAVISRGAAGECFKAYSRHKAGKAHLDEFLSAEAARMERKEREHRERYATMRGKVSLPDKDQLLLSAFARYLQVAQLVRKK
jgi:hypothetical protein